MDSKEIIKYTRFQVIYYQHERATSASHCRILPGAKTITRRHNAQQHTLEKGNLIIIHC